MIKDNIHEFPFQKYYLKFLYLKNQKLPISSSLVGLKHQTKGGEGFGSKFLKSKLL